MTPEQGGAEPWLYLAEMAHRVANEYSLAVSSLSLAAVRSESREAKDALTAAAARLRRYAVVHRALQAPVDTGEIDLSDHLRTLCCAMVEASLAERGIRLILIERPIQLDRFSCWKVGLIVSELVTNAVRHAFRGAGGTIVIELLAADLAVSCRIADDGRGFSWRQSEIGSGSLIVEALARDLGGSIDHEACKVGASVLVTFPRPEPRIA